MFVVMKIQDFVFEPVNLPMPVSIDKGKLKGFLPVYDTLEDAMEEFPDSEYVEVREKAQ